MEFYRFEHLQRHHFNPHLSSTQGPIIEGQHMFFRRVIKPRKTARPTTGAAEDILLW